MGRICRKPKLIIYLLMSRILRDYTRGPFSIKGWRHSPLMQEIAFINWFLLTVRFCIFIACFTFSIDIYPCISNVLSILVLSSVIIDLYISIHFFLIRKQAIICTEYPLLKFLGFLLLSFIFLLIMMYFVFESRELYAENSEYNPRLKHLAEWLSQAKYQVLDERTRMHIWGNNVTLAEVGWNSYYNHADKIDLFERFIDRNPHLQAFSSYYKFSIHFTVNRCFSRVSINRSLLDPLDCCTDMSI